MFVGLERTGGWMCWDVTDAEAPVFQVTANWAKRLRGGGGGEDGKTVAEKKGDRGGGQTRGGVVGMGGGIEKRGGRNEGKKVAVILMPSAAGHNQRLLQLKILISLFPLLRCSPCSFVLFCFSNRFVFARQPACTIYIHISVLHEL